MVYVISVLFLLLSLLLLSFVLSPISDGFFETEGRGIRRDFCLCLTEHDGCTFSMTAHITLICRTNRKHDLFYIKYAGLCTRMVLDISLKITIVSYNSIPPIKFSAIVFESDNRPASFVFHKSEPP